MDGLPPALVMVLAQELWLWLGAGWDAKGMGVAALFGLMELQVAVWDRTFPNGIGKEELVPHGVNLLWECNGCHRSHLTGDPDFSMEWESLTNQGRPQEVMVRHPEMVVVQGLHVMWACSLSRNHWSANVDILPGPKAASRKNRKPLSCVIA
jgi:hypothetical protein